MKSSVKAIVCALFLATATTHAASLEDWTNSKDARHLAKQAWKQGLAYVTVSCDTQAQDASLRWAGNGSAEKQSSLDGVTCGNAMNVSLSVVKFCSKAGCSVKFTPVGNENASDADAQIAAAGVRKVLKG